VAPSNGTPTRIGYYRLYSNSTVAGFASNSNYTGNYRIFNSISSAVASGSGRLDLTFSVFP
jgi:hypothetical protein